jgi:HAMP domain-containing protein
MFGGESVRRGVVTVTALIVEVLVGMWLLFLFLLAIAWSPIERRLSARERRADRFAEGEALDEEATGQASAFAVGASEVETAEEDDTDSYPTLALRRA